MRYWTDDAAIGSEIFVREIAAKLFGSNRAERKLLAKGSPSGATKAEVIAHLRLSGRNGSLLGHGE